MLTASKIFILSAAAVLSASTASAQDAADITFRYDRTLSVEKNYAAFERTAKRACDGLFREGNRARRKCRVSLIEQAVSATKQGGFITHHESRNTAVRSLAALVR